MKRLWTRYSPIKNRTRSKPWKAEVLVPASVPEPQLLSYSEDEKHRPQPSKRKRASPAPPGAGGHATYFRNSANQFPIIASKKLVKINMHIFISVQKLPADSNKFNSVSSLSGCVDF
jgi:hypothetical protein